MLVLTGTVWDEMVGHCVGGAPLEACGLLAGTPPGPAGAARATSCFVAVNAEASARVYTVEPRDMLRADRRAEETGEEVLGVYHSHTHTEPYPSPTDVAAAPDPAWHYVLVSLRDTEPSVRSYLIVDGKIQEEPVVLE